MSAWRARTGAICGRLPCRRTTATASLLLGLVGYGAAVHAENPNALWQIVHDQCVPEWQRHRKLTRPCVFVNSRGGYAVIRDRKGANQFLLIPTRRIAGIESRGLLAPHAVDYFAAAWRSRKWVERAVGHAMPPDMLSLAVNSQFARSQNQLHIHIDCVRPDVRDALNDRAAAIGARWSPFDVWFFGHHYRAMTVAGTTLAGRNPFQLLAAGIAGARANMGQYTLVVVGARFAGNAPGFVILADRADPANGDRAGGEELQDHGCALGRQPAQAR